MTDTSTAFFSIPLTLVLPAAPLLFAAAHLVLSPRSTTFHYRLGLFGTVFTTIISFAVVAAFAPFNGFQRRYTISLLPSITLPVRRGVDGLSLFFLPLTTGVTLLCILSLNPQTPRLREALIYLSVLQAGVLATFLALDLLAFFLFFERTLLPLFRLVLLWGSRERRVRASYRIAIYTLFGSIFRFFNLLYLLSKAGTTDYRLLSNLVLNVEDQRFLWGTFFLAFAAKVPLLPLHLWLPEAHVEAPTIGSVLLAALLLKLGPYGLLRFARPLFPEGTVYFGPLVVRFALRGVLYTCLTALRQIDLKKVVAYSSVSHRNVVLLGLRTETSEGIQGAIFQRLSHGIISGGLFFCVGVLYERYSVRSLKYFGGVAHVYPLFAIAFLRLALGNIAFPLTSAFVGEFLLFLSRASWQRTVAALAAPSRVLGAAYTLWAVNRILFGNLRTLSLAVGPDLTVREQTILGSLIVLRRFRGIAPTPILDARLFDSRTVVEQARRVRAARLLPLGESYLQLW